MKKARHSMLGAWILLSALMMALTYQDDSGLKQLEQIVETLTLE